MSWLFAGDEELGKKNDDHRPLNGLAPSTTWGARRKGEGIRKRRIIYAICAALLVYVFVKNIPTDQGPSQRFAPSYLADENPKLPIDYSSVPAGRPKKPATVSEAEEHYHDGPIKFHLLAASLHSAARLGGQHDSNKNVLFAASSLKSASEIIPLACEMARWDRNDVHFAIMGRDDLDLQEIRRVNGAEEDCNVHWHDARPDYSRWSTDFRMEVSVTASLEHINTFVHPQVILIDESSREDPFFTKAMRSKAMDAGKSLIELPIDAVEHMMWLTRLDSASLAAWTRTHVEVLIQAPAASSGSLTRLLRSLENADYFGMRRPHLTIELPTEIEPSTYRYLENLVWPPLDWSGQSHVSQVSIRHRVPRRTSTEYEASARFVESFYPARPANSHVLILSPQVELSPLYFHYVIYQLLEYKYSAHGKAAKEALNLVGISLELPSFHLNDTTALHPPKLKRFSGPRNSTITEERTPFLWQAPNNNAALYFGDKWIEFHSFLSARLSKPPSTRRKVYSEKHPSWLEMLLELIRNRGYYLIYPNFPNDEDAIVTIHDELFRVPEEYLKEPSITEAPTPDLDPNNPLTKDYNRNDRGAPPHTETTLLSTNLVNILPNSADLPELSNMPLLSYNGIDISRELSHEAAMAFSSNFQIEIGECSSSSETTSRQHNSAIDLFCRLDDVYDPMQPQNPPSDVSSQDPGQRQPYDEDMIAPEEQKNAKAESAAHLSRQKGKRSKPAHVQPRTPSRPPPWQPQQDDSKETQNEFRLQMQRQARHSGSHGGQKEEGRSGSGTIKDRSKVKTVQTGQGNPEPENESKSASPPEHLGFTKQAPKQVLEPAQGDAKEEKGAGW